MRTDSFERWTILVALALVALALASGCGAKTTENASDDLIPVSNGKSDTGYLSNLAAELEGTFESTLVLDISDKDEAGRQSYLAELQEKSWTLKSLLNAHMKLAKNQMNADKLHLNLSADDVRDATFELSEAGVLTIKYVIHMETIVTNAELAKEGTNIEELLDKSFKALLPSDHRDLFEKIGDKCSDGFEEGGIHEYNYFYYFSAAKEGCREALEGVGRTLVEATFTIKNPMSGKTVYPEYDRLREDGQIKAVIFFGAADHSWEPGKWDWGVANYEQFSRDLKNNGFKKASDDPEENLGTLYHRKRADLDEYVRVIGPDTLALLKDDTNGLFEKMVKDNELVFYNGHSFYGSLSVLKKKEIFPANTYQIFFMNSCWSYEYYTKQIFQAKVTEDDAQGFKLADVVNNTEPGWFHNMGSESRILLLNILAGAEANGRDGNRYYTWDRIIGKMNQHAVDQTYRLKEDESNEIYGVSGVTTNTFEPPVVQ